MTFRQINLANRPKAQLTPTTTRRLAQCCLKLLESAGLIFRDRHNLNRAINHLNTPGYRDVDAVNLLVLPQFNNLFLLLGVCPRRNTEIADAIACIKTTGFVDIDIDDEIIPPRLHAESELPIAALRDTHQVELR